MNEATTIPTLTQGSPEATRIPDHELLQVIGRGSYGEVWEARNLMGTPRAVKIVRKHDFDYARPFEREFEGITRYEPISRSHAGLVQVLHVGKEPCGRSFYYVMELGDPDRNSGQDHYVPKTLRSELLHRTALPVEACIDIGISLASGLGHLHRNGLVHRDVKPANIIYVDGAPKLADVGLVAAVSDTRSLVGTEGYLAPDGTGQPRSDIYSLGKVLYECITGNDRQAFPDVPDTWGSTPESKAAFEFMEIVLRAAEGDPARRYADTDEMLSDLAMLKAGKSLRHLRGVETRLKRAGQILAFSAMGISLAAGAWLYERYKRGQVEAAETLATQAQRETQQLLAKSLLEEARAVRLSGEAGAREKALNAVRRGLKAGAPLLDLRTQAASALALTDVGNLTIDGIISASNHRVVWSPDGSRAAIAEGTTGQVRIINRLTNAVTVKLNTKPDLFEVFLPADPRWVATVHEDFTLCLWQTGDGGKVFETTLPPDAGGPEFSKDGTWLVFSTLQGLEVRSCEGGDPFLPVPGAPVMRSIQLAPDATWLACLPVPDGGKGTARELGFRIYKGLPGRRPGPTDVAGITEHVITSDILLDGASISADSRYLAAAVSEDRLRVFEMPSMSQVAWLRGHQRSVRRTAFHPHDSSIVASTSWDGTTILWDVPTRRQLLVIPTGGDYLNLLPDRQEILIRTWDGDTIRSLPLSKRSALKVLALPANTPLGLFNDLTFNPEGSLLAAAGDAGVIAWHTASWDPIILQPPTKPDQWRSVLFKPDGSACYFSGKEGIFRRKLTRSSAGKLEPGGREQTAKGFASYMTWCGNKLAQSGRRDNGTIGVWLSGLDGTNGHLVPSQPPDRVAASPDGQWFITSRYPNGGGTLWDMHQQPPAAVDVETFGRACFNFTADSSTLIIGTDTSISFRSAAHPDKEVRPPLSRRNCEIIPAHSASSAASGLVAISTAPDEITLCDGRTLEPVLKLNSPLTPFDCSIAFSPDGTKLALAGGVSRVIIWDIAWIRDQLTASGLGW